MQDANRHVARSSETSNGSQKQCAKGNANRIYILLSEWKSIHVVIATQSNAKKNKIPSKILEQRHAPFDATDKIKWNTRVYTPRNAIISLISNLLSSIYLFFSPFFRTFEH